MINYQQSGTLICQDSDYFLNSLIIQQIPQEITKEDWIKIEQLESQQSTEKFSSNRNNLN